MSKAKVETEAKEVIPPHSSFFADCFKFVICASGLYTCHLLYGFAQETIANASYGGEKFPFTSFLLLMQSSFNLLIGFLFFFIFNKGENTPPLTSYAIPAIVLSIAAWFSSASLLYTSYPAQILAKSCKPIPIMLISMVVAGRKYPLRKYLCIVSVVVSVATFFFLASSSKGDVDFTPLGLIYIAISLTCDGIGGAFQDKFLQAHAPVGTGTLIIYANAWSIIVSSPMAVTSGELVKALTFIGNHPEILTHLLAYVLCAGLGQIFVYMTVSNFGPLVTSILTTTRKLFSVLASVVLFGHPVSPGQWACVAVVFAGLLLDAFFAKAAKAKAIAEKQILKSPDLTPHNINVLPSPSSSESDETPKASPKTPTSTLRRRRGD